MVRIIFFMNVFLTFFFIFYFGVVSSGMFFFLYTYIYIYIYLHNIYLGRMNLNVDDLFYKKEYPNLTILYKKSEFDIEETPSCSL